MSIEPEGAPSEVPANKVGPAARDAKPAGLTPDTVPRFFNWGAFLIPVPWCLAMRQWVWAIAAAATPLTLVIIMWMSIGLLPPSLSVIYAVAWILAVTGIGLLLVCPLWISPIAGIGLIGTTSGSLKAEIVWHVLPVLAFCLIPFAISLYLGFAGNRLAAQSRTFSGVAGFRVVQRKWAIWGLLMYLIALPLLCLLLYLLLFLRGVFALV